MDIFCIHLLWTSSIKQFFKTFHKPTVGNVKMATVFEKKFEPESFFCQFPCSQNISRLVCLFYQCHSQWTRWVKETFLKYCSAQTGLDVRQCSFLSKPSQHFWFFNLDRKQKKDGEIFLSKQVNLLKVIGSITF